MSPGRCLYGLVNVEEVPLVGVNLSDRKTSSASCPPTGEGEKVMLGVQGVGEVEGCCGVGGGGDRC